MADITSLPSAATHVSTAEALSTPRPLIATVQWQNFWTTVGGATGAVLAAYAVGAAVEALRLHQAGLPVEQAISVVPRTAIITLAANALFLPALISALIGMAAVAWSQKYTERELDAAGLEKARAKAKRVRLHKEVRNAAGLARRAVWRILEPVFVRILAPAWRKTIGRLPVSIQGWALIAPIVVLFVPLRVAGLTGLVAGAIQLPMMSHIAKHRALRTISRRREVVMFGMVGALSVSLQTMGQQILVPGPLPRGSVQVADKRTETRGDYIATTPEGVYLGIRGQLVLIPDRLVDRTTVWNAPEPQEKPQNLIERIE